MNKLLTEIIAAYAKTMQECAILYKLDKISLKTDKLSSTINFSLLGTGKAALPRSLLSIYESNMLLQFRPEDIKTISTAATLIKNDIIFNELEGFDLLSNPPTVKFKTRTGRTKLSYKLTEIEENPDILKKTDGHSGYLIANCLKDFQKNT